MFNTLVELALASVKFLHHEKANEIRDRVIELRKAHYEEINKDPARRSDARLDTLEHELRLLSGVIASGLGKQDAAPQP